MKYTNFASLVRSQTRTDSTSFPNSALTLYANVAKDYVAETIVELSEDYFDLTLTTDLIESQREYAFPLDVLKGIKMLEGRLNGVEWKRINEFDLNSYRLHQGSRTKNYSVLDVRDAFSNATTDERSITDYFSDENPLFDIDGQSIFIYSATAPIAVTAGLKLRASIYPADFTDSIWSSTDDISYRLNSTSTALPRASHEVLARKTMLLYKQANNMPLDEYDYEFESMVKRMRSRLSRINRDRVVKPKVIRDNGFDY